MEGEPVADGVSSRLELLLVARAILSSTSQHLSLLRMTVERAREEVEDKSKSDASQETEVSRWLE